MLDRIFYDFEAATIKNIPLCHSFQEDVLLWPFNPDGEYSVKSGYRFLQEANTLQQLGPSNAEAMNLSRVKYGVWRCQIRLKT